MPAPVPPRLEVIADHDAVQADLLGEDGVIDQLTRPNCSADALYRPLDSFSSSWLRLALTWWFRLI